MDVWILFVSDWGNLTVCLFLTGMVFYIPQGTSTLTREDKQCCTVGNTAASYYTQFIKLCHEFRLLGTCIRKVGFPAEFYQKNRKAFSSCLLLFQNETALISEYNWALILPIKEQ